MTFKDLPPDTRDAYDWLDPESKLAPLVIVDGKVRFKPNHAVQWVKNQINLNNLWIAAGEGWPMEDLMQFYRLIGYSLNGFGEIFGDYLDELAEKGKVT